MKNFYIYLAGGMEKFGKDNFNTGNAWREMTKAVLENCDSIYKINVINPNDYYNFIDDPPEYKSAKEIIEYDLNRVRHSDLIICNFNDKYSLGAMSELTVAYEHRIPVVGINTDKIDLHPWQKEFCLRICSNMDEMFTYVQKFFLN